jgi:hypothetical protein
MIRPVYHASTDPTLTLAGDLHREPCQIAQGQEK